MGMGQIWGDILDMDTDERVTYVKARNKELAQQNQTQ